MKLLCIFMICMTGTALANDGGFLFVTFRGEQSPMTEQIYFALSKDGRTWEALNDEQPVLVSTLGEKGVRDPYLLRSHDGKKFFLIATDLSINLNRSWGRAVKAGSQSIVIWESEDLVHWSDPRLVKIAADDAGCAWAPEAVYDEQTKDYLVFWASKTASDQFAKHRIWASRTKDFMTFSPAFIYIEKSQDVIDTDIISDNGKYYRFSKDEKFKAIAMEVSDSLMGPWKDVQDFSLEKLVGYEGPECYQVEPASGGKPATWCLILDQYSKGKGYQPFVTQDLAGGQFTAGEGFQFPFPFRHGSILPVSAEEYQRLKESYGKKTVAVDESAPVPKPILDGFTADPSIRVFGDTYYIYPTSDKPNWKTTDFSVWSSKNLIDWKKEGVVLDVTKDLKWANIEAWAPDCIERNGTFYFYFCAQRRIGVATSNRPTGPFVDALGKPLLDRKADPKITTNTIDPYPFIDDDGQAYLYFGSGGERTNVFKLKADMVTLDGDPVTISIKGTRGGNVVDFREGIVVFKRKGIYYFMWSVDDARSEDYRVAYGTAKSPLGPVDIPEDSLVLKKNGLVKGTGHHSVVNVPGTDQWYMVYHRHAIPGGSGYQRETCLARMEFNEDGSIKPIDPLVPVVPTVSRK